MKKGIRLGITSIVVCLLLLMGSGAPVLAGGPSLPDDDRERPEIQDLVPKIDGLLEAEIRERPGEKIPIIIVLEPGQWIALPPEAEDVRELPLINAIAATVPAEGIEAIATLPGVEMVWLDEKIELIPPPEIDKAAAPAGWVSWIDWGDERIGAPALWEKGLTGKGIRIAILDTGIDKYHWDFGDRVIAGKDFTEEIDWGVRRPIAEGVTHEFPFAFRDTTDLVVELWWVDPANDLGLILVEPDGVTTHTGTDPEAFGNFKRVTIAAPVDGWHPDPKITGLWTIQVIGDAVTKTEIYDLVVAYHSPWDGHGHGTHVGGIAAGAHNPDAVVPVGPWWAEVPTPTPVYGVAPEALLLNAKVLTRGGWGFTSWIIAGVEWSMAQEANILNLSLGMIWQFDGTGRSPLELALTAAVKAGLTVVNAAGNQGPGEATIGSPALAHGVIAVAASTVSDGIIFFSSRGPAGDGRFGLDLAAPGVFVVAPLPLHVDILGYDFWHGTSMSAPHVAGAAALLLQAFAPLTPAEMERALKNAADDLAVCLLEQGAGRLDVADAHNAILGGILVDHEWSVGRVFPGVHSKIFTVINEGAEAVTLTITEALMTDTQGVLAGDWLALPANVTVPAGATATFDVTMTVPLDAVGIYVGGITLTAAGTHIIVPISVMVMQLLRAPFTTLEATGIVDEPWDWVFYTLEVEPGIGLLVLELDWTDQDNVLALFIFNPVGELVVWEWGGAPPLTPPTIERPAEGKWTVAILAWHLPRWHPIHAPYIPVTYTLTSAAVGTEITRPTTVAPLHLKPGGIVTVDYTIGGAPGKISVLIEIYDGGIVIGMATDTLDVTELVGQFTMSLVISKVAPEDEYNVRVAFAHKGVIHEDIQKAAVIVDATPPGVINLAVTDDVINRANVAKVEITGVTEPGSAVVVRLTDTAVPARIVEVSAVADAKGAFTATADATTLADGKISVDAMATDRAGNIGPWSAPITVIKDTVAPLPPTKVAVTGDVINIANVAAVEITGVAVEGYEVVVRLTDGVGVVETKPVTAGADGAFTATADATALADGKISVDAMATDPAGNPGAWSVPITVTKDTVAPLVIDLAVTKDVINIANVAKVEITGVTEPDSAVVVRLTDAAVPAQVVSVTAVADAKGAFTATADATALEDGKISVDAMATDRAGNPGPWSAPITVIKDTVAPQAPATLTAKAVPGVIILTWDAVADAVSYRIYRDETHIAVEVTTTYTDTYGGLVPGVTYHYEVKAVDAVGNVGPASPKASATFIAGYPYALKLTANPTEILADGVAISKITALVTDEWGRPVKDATVVLETNAGFIHPLTAVTGADGKAMVTLTASTTIETATVSAAVADYPEVTGTTTVEFVAQSFEIGLRVGWNLISLPLIPTDPDIKVVLEGVKGIEIVWAYDAVTERWLSWIPGRPDQFQTLKTMEDGLGFWVLMRAPATLTVEGFVMPPPPVIPPVYEVVAGWNLIGFRSLETTTTASDHLRGISWTVLWRFGAEGFVRVLPLHSMIPGAGYWLFAEEPGRIAIIENGK